MKLDRVFSNMNRYYIGIFIIIYRCLNKDNENMMTQENIVKPTSEARIAETKHVEKDTDKLAESGHV